MTLPRTHRARRGRGRRARRRRSPRSSSTSSCATELRGQVDDALERPAPADRAHPARASELEDGSSSSSPGPSSVSRRSVRAGRAVRRDGPCARSATSSCRSTSRSRVADGRAAGVLQRRRRGREARARAHLPVRPPDYAVQVARPLTEVDETLVRLGLFLLLIAARRDRARGRARARRVAARRSRRCAG